MTSDKNLLILDLDETLIRAVTKKLDRPHDFCVERYFIYKRPFLSEFIETCLTHFRVGVWSSASDQYVESVVSLIFPDPDKLLFVWAASKITYQRTLPHHYEKFGREISELHNQKRLKKVSKAFDWSLDRILIVDDSPEKSAQNYGNVIHPKPYLGDADDRELPHLAGYLENLSVWRDLRSIEKRNWREKVEPKQWS